MMPSSSFLKRTLAPAVLAASAFHLAGCVATRTLAVDKSDGSAYLMLSHDPAAPLSAQELGTLREKAGRTGAALKQTPKNTTTRLAQAQMLLVNGDLARAEALARAILASDFRSRPAKILMAHSAYLKKNFDEAQSILNQLGGDRAAESEVLNLIACIAIENKDLAGAERLFVSAIQRNPDDIAARMNAGSVALRRGQLELAEMQFKEVLKRVPDNADAMTQLGTTYAHAGRLELAIEAYKDALNHRSSQQAAAYNLAVAYKRSGDYASAISSIKDLIALKNLQYGSREAAHEFLEQLKVEQAAGAPIPGDELKEMLASLKEASGNRAAH